VNEQAEEIFQRFRSLPGAHEMASPCAIEGLLTTVERYRPRRILEVGAGIGTLTAAILAAAPTNARIASVEDNAYCLEQLAINLGTGFERVTVLASTDDLTGEFDLVVVDGHQLIDIVGYIARNGLVFVEANREAQRDAVDNSGRSFCIKHVRTLRRMAPDDPWGPHQIERYQSGYWLVRFEPSTRERGLFAMSDWWNSGIIGWRRRVRRALGLERTKP
jgi:hypothetical protein